MKSKKPKPSKRPKQERLETIKRRAGENTLRTEVDALDAMLGTPKKGKDKFKAKKKKND